MEAGLIVRELLLRRRFNFVVVAAPASMILQWQDEMAQKFGLDLTIVDSEHLARTRQLRGFAANPWELGSFFGLSHAVPAEDAYVGPLRGLMGSFRPGSLLILDEAHHAAPSSGRAYAVESQFTRGVRDLAGRFEHRLFLSATPHNGHSNASSTLLEILDSQRFTRGIPVGSADLEPVMVRCLKEDLRQLGEGIFIRLDSAAIQSWSGREAARHRAKHLKAGERRDADRRGREPEHLGTAYWAIHGLIPGASGVDLCP